jgi:tyrosyl-tRNA synthetase
LTLKVAAGEVHPKQAKVQLARDIVTTFHDASAADAAAAEFERVHAKGELPSDLREVSVDFGNESSRALTRILVDAGLAPSTSEAGRRIQQGGVKVGGDRVADLKRRVSAGELPVVVQSGRHAVRLVR